MSKIKIVYDDSTYEIGEFIKTKVCYSEMTTPSIPFYQELKHVDGRDFFITLNGCVYDEYTEIYHIMIEAFADGDDPPHIYIFDSSITDDIIEPIWDFREIPSEYFISEIEEKFETTHSGE